MTDSIFKADWGFRHRGTIGAALLGPAGLAMLLSRPMIAEGTWANVALDALGWLCFVAGVTFRFWSTFYVGGRKFRTLPTEGPYSMCRNPLYVGSFLLYVAAALFLKSATFGAVVGLVILNYRFATVPVEEGNSLPNMVPHTNSTVAKYRVSGPGSRSFTPANGSRFAYLGCWSRSSG